MICRIVFYSLLLSWLPFCAQAQELLFSSAMTDVELPSQECYKILQDDEGYIWFATDNGLCRYGTGKLTVFDDRNGLPERSVYVIAKDRRGRMWFHSSADRILYFDPATGKLKEAPFNKQYRSMAKGDAANPYPMTLHMDDPENSYICNIFDTYHYRQSTNKVTHIARPGEAHATFVKPEGLNRFLTFRFNYSRFDAQFDVTLVSGKQQKKITLDDMSLQKMIHWNFQTAHTRTADFIGIEERLIKVNPDLSYSYYDLPGRILFLYTDASDGLWVGLLNNGVLYFPDVKTMKAGPHSLRSYSVTAIAEDKEQGIWCTTLEKGVFHCGNPQLLSYTAIPGLDQRASLLKFTEGNLFVSATAGDLFQLGNNGFKRYPFPFPETIFSDIVHDPDNKGWALCGRELVIFADEKYRFLSIMRQPNLSICSGYEFTRVDNTVYYVIGKSLNAFDFKKKKPISKIYGTQVVTRTLASGWNDSILIGGDQGLLCFNLVTKQQKMLAELRNIRKLLKVGTACWIGTRSDGIYRWNNGKLENMSQLLHLPEIQFYDFVEDRLGNIWIGCNRGLYCLKPAGTHFEATCYTKIHGLPSNDVYKVAADLERIWFSTYEGLFSLPLATDFRNRQGPSVKLRRLTINNVSMKLKNRLSLPYDRNNLRLVFDILTFRNNGTSRLVYNLNDADRTSVTTINGNEILLENLDPGTYRIAVYGLNDDGVKSANPEVFEIVIAPPFWQTWWFFLLEALLLIGIVFLIVRRIVRGIRKREEAKTQVNKLIAEYQITALQSQMNPHFIFNAINTIQGFILEKNVEEAYDYLAKFGRLIRMVLHHSQEQTLLLEHELELLSLYIELEQLRFDHCFDYRLVLEDDLDPESVYLPAMLLQPYIENAIWHGLVNLKDTRRGLLDVIISREQDTLLFRIEDNGIGRELAMSFNRNRRHKSVSMHLTAERIRVMNQLHGYETASVTVTDLYDENGKPRGTSVALRIPLNT